MAIEDDFTVALDGDIRYTGGGSTYYTVLEVHRFLQDLADDAQASGNDLVDITSTKPSERSTDNIIELIAPFNIDDDAAEQIYDGSITQEGGDTVYSGLVVVGAVETGTELIIIRDNTIITDWWGTGINAVPAANILLRVIIKTRFEGVDIDGKKVLVMAREFGDSYSEFSATLGLGNGTAAIFTSEDLNNTTGQSTVNAWDCSNTEGYQQIDLNNGNGDRDYYSKWDLGAQVAINDIYEFTKDIQRRTSGETIHTMNGQYFRGITTEFDWQTGGVFTEDRTVAWGCTFSFSTESGGPFVLGERLDFGTSLAVGRLVGLVDNTGDTGFMVIQVESGTPANTNTITGTTSTATGVVSSAPAGIASTAGTGIILANDDNTGTGTMWIQRLTGIDPVDAALVREVGVADNDITCAVDTNITARTVSPEFYGQSTGLSIIGAFGIGHLPGDLGATDKLFDLTNTLQQPPNNQVFYVYKVVVDEDRVMVGPNDGGDELEYDQFTINGTLTDNVTTTVVINAGPIPSDTPASGTIRVQDNNGVYTRQPYDSWDTNTFTLTAAYQGSDDADATDGNECFISYVDKVATSVTETYTSIYGSPRSLVVKVRDGGTAGDFEPIKPFKTGATFGSGGGSATAIRTSDA